VTHKSDKISAIIEAHRGRDLDAHYLGFFGCFNRGLYFEAHEVLEELWLAQRTGPNGSFYKGLIQLAGAFVHLQRNRLHPAAALFKLAAANLRNYPAVHERLDVRSVLRLIEEWLQRLGAARFEKNPFTSDAGPKLELQTGS
jgi:predicted metal-dependent hydrolase